MGWMDHLWEKPQAVKQKSQAWQFVDKQGEPSGIWGLLRANLTKKNTVFLQTENGELHFLLKTEKLFGPTKLPKILRARNSWSFSMVELPVEESGIPPGKRPSLVGGWHMTDLSRMNVNLSSRWKCPWNLSVNIMYCWYHLGGYMEVSDIWPSCSKLVDCKRIDGISFAKRNQIRNRLHLDGCLNLYVNHGRSTYPPNIPPSEIKV